MQLSPNPKVVCAERLCCLQAKGADNTRRLRRWSLKVVSVVFSHLGCVRRQFVFSHNM